MKPTIFTGYSSLDSIRETAKQLLAYAGEIKVWLFLGELGAGKTTFIKALCAELGVQEVVTSPTFALVHEYGLPSGDVIYHIDAYRVEPAHAVIEWQSYLDTGSYCLIEWPTQLGAVDLPSHLVVALEAKPNGIRCIQAYIKN